MEQKSHREAWFKNIQRFDKTDTLKCPLCLNTFETPRALACLHTFCEPCLEFYITDCKTGATDGKLNQIQCPVCQHPTMFKDVTKHPSNLVKDFPLNHFILPKLKGAVPQSRRNKAERQGKRVNFSQCCRSCTEKGVVVEATSYCKECADFFCNVCVDSHSKIKLFVNHRIVGIDLVTNDFQSSNCFDRHNFCLHHQSQELRFYCDNHDLALCSDCVVSSHKMCEIINSFDDLGLEVKQGDKAWKLTENLKGLQKALINMTEAIRTNNYGIKRESEDIPKRIQAMKTKVLRLFQYLEETTEANIRNFQEEFGKINSEKSFKCKQLIAAIESSLVAMETVLEHGTYTQMFFTFQRLKFHLHEYDEMVKLENDALVCSSIQLKTDLALDAIINGCEKLGEVFAECIKPDLASLPPLLFARPKVDADDIKPDLVKSFELKVSEANVIKECINASYMDKKLVMIFKLTNRAWVTYNMSLISTETFEEILTLDLKRDPRNVIIIDNHNLAITFPNAGCIEFYLYTPKRRKKPAKCELDHSVQCEIRDFVVARFNKRNFAVSNCNCFGTMSHEGALQYVFYYSVSLRVRENDFWSTQLTVQYITVNFKKKRIYIVSSKPDKLYSFSTEGEVAFEYEFNGPVTCLDLDKNGNISVCKMMGTTANLFQISPNTGKPLRTVETVSKCPSIACFNQKGNDFYTIENKPTEISLNKYRFHTDFEEELLNDD